LHFCFSRKVHVHGLSIELPQLPCSDFPFTMNPMDIIKKQNNIIKIVIIIMLIIIKFNK